MTFTNVALEEYIGKEITSVTNCNMTDITDLQKRWLPQFFLTSICKAKYNRPQHQMVLNFLRKTEKALDEYDAAKISLGKYVTTDNSVVTPYFDTISHLEVCISYGYQSLELLMTLFEKRLFTKGDGSNEEKLNLIYNNCKHINKEIKRKDWPIEHTGPVWLSNNGLETQNISFSFVLLREIMEDLVEYAEMLTVKFPSHDKS